MIQPGDIVRLKDCGSAHWQMAKRYGQTTGFVVAIRKDHQVLVKWPDTDTETVIPAIVLDRVRVDIELSPIAVYSINEYLRATSLITQHTHRFNRNRWLYVTHYAVVGCNCPAHQWQVVVAQVAGTGTYTVELGAEL